MPYTVEDYKHELALEILPTLTNEERLRGISEEEQQKLLEKLLPHKGKP